MSRQYEDIGTGFNKIIDKACPVPKTPRAYRSRKFAVKATSLFQSGTLGDPKFEARLRELANIIKNLNDKMSGRKYSSRGWCYILEGEGKITKEEFDACADRINDCRKANLLPIDFVKEDQDESRRFSGIIQKSNPAAELIRIQNNMTDLIEHLVESNTDFWKGEEYYLMLCCEKGDIKELLAPICKQYHVPLVSSKGWGSINVRADIATLAKNAEASGLTPVMLLFYDLDISGMKISTTFRDNLENISKGTGWNPINLVIERIGLNKNQVEENGLMWIDNLLSGSGKEPRHNKDYHEYIAEIEGEKKCELNAFVKNPATEEAAVTICQEAIEHYYGVDAVERFAKKEEEMKANSPEIFNNPIWKNFQQEIEKMIVTEKAKMPHNMANASFVEKKPLECLVKSITVLRYDTGYCPKCCQEFKYENKDIGRLLICKNCDTLMRLKEGIPRELTEYQKDVMPLLFKIRKMGTFTP